jgi:hypothetical protein
MALGKKGKSKGKRQKAKVKSAAAESCLRELGVRSG